MAGKSQTSGLAASIAAAGAAIEAKRARIAELQSDRDGISAASADKEEIARRVDRAIADAEAVGNLQFSDLSMPDEGRWRAEFEKRAAASPFAFFAALAPDALRSALIEGAPAGGITAADRAAKLTAIEDELLALECQEELICRGFDGIVGRGSEFPRRPDARPEILCAPDPELEA